MRTGGPPAGVSRGSKLGASVQTVRYRRYRCQRLIGAPIDSTRPVILNAEAQAASGARQQASALRHPARPAVDHFGLSSALLHRQIAAPGHVQHQLIWPYRGPSRSPGGGPGVGQLAAATACQVSGARPVSTYPGGLSVQRGQPLASQPALHRRPETAAASARPASSDPARTGGLSGSTGRRATAIAARSSIARASSAGRSSAASSRPQQRISRATGAGSGSAARARSIRTRRNPPAPPMRPPPSSQKPAGGDADQPIRRAPCLMRHPGGGGRSGVGRADGRRSGVALVRQQFTVGQGVGHPTPGRAAGQPPTRTKHHGLQPASAQGLRAATGSTE